MSCGSFGCFINENHPFFIYVKQYLDANKKKYPTGNYTRIYRVKEDLSEELVNISENIFKDVKGFKLMLPYAYFSTEKSFKDVLYKEIIGQKTLINLITNAGYNYKELTTYTMEKSMFRVYFKYPYLININSAKHYVVGNVYIILLQSCDSLIPFDIINKEDCINKFKLLSILHNNYYTHGDIKINNIVNCNKKIKFIDFGSLSNEWKVESTPIYLLPFVFCYYNIKDYKTKLLDFIYEGENKLYMEKFRLILINFFNKWEALGFIFNFDPQMNITNKIILGKIPNYSKPDKMTPIQYLNIKADDYAIAIVIMRIVNINAKNISIIEDILNALLDFPPFFINEGPKLLELVVDKTINENINTNSFLLYYNKKNGNLKNTLLNLVINSKTKNTDLPKIKDGVYEIEPNPAPLYIKTFDPIVDASPQTRGELLLEIYKRQLVEEQQKKIPINGGKKKLKTSRRQSKKSKTSRRRAMKSKKSKKSKK